MGFLNDAGGRVTPASMFLGLETCVSHGLVNLAGNGVHALLGIATKILTCEQLAKVDRNFVIGKTCPQGHVWLGCHGIVDRPLDNIEMARCASANNECGVGFRTLAARWRAGVIVVP